jgi:RNA polymerase sigma-70 factor (ECF subfamily)
MDSQNLQSFEACVREHQAGLRAFIRSLGAQEIWVDDLAQEAFLIAYRRLNDFETGADFGAWIRGIARNLVANERRKEVRRSRLLHGSLVDVLMESATAGPRDEADLSAWVTVMQECVGQLTARSRDLLRRRYAGGEKASGLARELGLSAASVRQKLRRIRLWVKECVENKLVEAKP